MSQPKNQASGELSVGVASLTGMAEPWNAEQWSAEQWSAEQVLSLAPDQNAATAGARMASARGWSRAGHRPQPAALWGLSQGSGVKPYETVVDLTGPAYTCSCPSRKFPCKHALGLMLLWSAGGLPVTEVPAEFAVAWLTRRATAEASKPQPTTSADPKAAAKRVADRAARVTAGLDDLDLWLCDQIRTGLAGLEHTGYRQFEVMAARMVDAQAPAVASRLRRLSMVLGSGEGWHGRLLEEYSLLRLLVRAHRRLGELPAQLAAVVRTQVGYPIPSAEVRVLPGVRDTWSVLGLRDEDDERLISRRIWLQGIETGRMAVLLSYAPVGRLMDDGSLTPGISLDADLHFYPGGGTRALVGSRYAEPGPLGRPVATSIETALRRYAAALAADPWVWSWPVMLAAVTPTRQAGQVDQPNRWVLREDSGAALPIATGAGAPWTLVACSGGDPVTVAGEWAPSGFTPICVIRRNDLVML